MSITKKCKVEGCENKGKLAHNGKRYFVKGLCNMHWIRQNRKGNLGSINTVQYRHGMVNHPLYSTWEGMNQRCNNKNHQAYKNYGGRGIKVCERWKNFANFLEDMGEKPSKEYTLDRIDNDGDYEPSNCRWATKTEQLLNQRLRKNNTSGFNGVRYKKETGNWYATITIDYKNVYLGSSKDKEVALKIRQSAEIVYKHCRKQDPSLEGSV